MSELVTVSSVENKEKLKSNLEDLFKRERYSEIGEAIGMHSILIDPQNTIADQANLYHFILNMIKNRIRTAKGKGYSAWYTGFPKLWTRSRLETRSSPTRGPRMCLHPAGQPSACSSHSMISSSGRSRSAGFRLPTS